MGNLAGVFELRQAMTAGDPVYFDGLVTRTKEQHERAIQRAEEDAVRFDRLAEQRRAWGQPRLTQRAEKDASMRRDYADRLRAVQPSAPRPAAAPTPTLCSICRGVHGPEVRHECE